MIFVLRIFRKETGKEREQDVRYKKKILCVICISYIRLMVFMVVKKTFRGLRRT